MALNWGTDEMKKRLGDARWNEVTTSPWPGEGGQEQWHPVTDRIVWHLLAIGISKITEENAEKVYRRISMIEEVSGPSLVYARDGKETGIFITMEDIRNHIGLCTNVTNMTDAKFNSHLADIVRRVAERRDRKERKSAHDMVAEQYEWSKAKA